MTVVSVLRLPVRPGREAELVRAFDDLEIFERSRESGGFLRGRLFLPVGRGPLRAVRTDDPGAPNSSGSWLGAFLNARAGTIYAGSSEIQRDIIAERLLGLPKDKRG